MTSKKKSKKRAVAGKKSADTKSADTKSADTKSADTKSADINYTTCMIALAIIVFSLVITVAYIYTIQYALQSKEAGEKNESLPAIVEGNVVSVDIIVQLEDGEMIDTTMEDVAKQNNIYNENLVYRPVTFVVGSGFMIKGVDDAVIGMREGEEKTVKIPSDKAYGSQDPRLVEDIQKVQISPRIQNTTLELFLEKIGEEPKVNASYKAPDLMWPITVVDVTDSTVVIRHDPKPNTTIDTVLGKANVTATEDEIKIIMPEVKVGQEIMVGERLARVVRILRDTIRIDLNHPLAGKTIIATIKIRAVNPLQIVMLKYFWSSECSYCERQEPILEALSTKHRGLSITKINIDLGENADEVERYDITNTPSFILSRGGTVRKGVGFMTEDKLEKFICQLLDDERCEIVNQLTT